MLTTLGGQRQFNIGRCPPDLMKPTIITIICAALIAIGAAYWLDAGELSHRTPYPKATPPPPPSPEFTPSPERAPTAREIDKASREHYALLQMSIERALVARDPQQRETAFTFLLPELLQVEPARVVQMMKKQEPGEARDALRREVARQWVMRDREAAVGWIKSLENDAERRDAAEIAVSALAAVAPDQAIEVADQFGIGATMAISNTWCRSGPSRTSTRRHNGPDRSPPMRRARNCARASTRFVPPSPVGTRRDATHPATTRPNNHASRAGSRQIVRRVDCARHEQTPFVILVSAERRARARHTGLFEGQTGRPCAVFEARQTIRLRVGEGPAIPARWQTLLLRRRQSLVRHVPGLTGRHR
jgi:hypothetical protein